MNRLLVTAVAIGIGAGCASVSPRENFASHMNLYRGAKLSDLKPYHFGREADLVSVSPLADGGTLNTYRYSNYGECLYAFEVGSDGVIVDWKIVSGAEACQVVP